MEMTPKRRQMIDAHIAETRALMSDYAFQLNDLVRFALSAAQDKPHHKMYHPMDPVHECSRNWRGLSQKLAKLAAEVDATTRRLGVAPFDAEGPAELDPPGPAAPESGRENPPRPMDGGS